MFNWLFNREERLRDLEKALDEFNDKLDRANNSLTAVAIFLQTQNQKMDCKKSSEKGDAK